MSTEDDRTDTASRTDEFADDRVATGKHGDHQVIEAEVIDPDSRRDTTLADPVARQEASSEDDVVPLFDEQSLEHLRDRWRDLQGEFVDDPRDAVAKADHLVAELIHELTSTYAERKELIADRWSDSPDTESLRRALRSYRSFFNQLLSPTA